MRDLDGAARRLATAAADLDAERQRDGGPRPAQVRQVADRLRDVVTGLMQAAQDIDDGAARHGT